jgi:hypothetical protein
MALLKTERSGEKRKQASKNNQNNNMMSEVG